MRSAKIIEIFLIIAQEPSIKGIHSHTLRLMRNARRRLISGLVDYAQCRQLFMAIIKRALRDLVICLFLLDMIQHT